MEMITIPKGGRPVSKTKPDADHLRKDYIEDAMSYIQLAEKYHVSITTITRWLRQYDIRKRR